MTTEWEIFIASAEAEALAKKQEPLRLEAKWLNEMANTRVFRENGQIVKVLGPVR
jgi:hypothetical protein